MSIHKTLILAVALLTAVAASAQEATQPESDGTFRSSLLPSKAQAPWSIGLYGGMTHNTHVVDMSYAEGMEYSAGSGLALGLTAAYHPTGWLALRAEPALVQKNYRLDRNNRYVNFAYTESTNNYLTLPVEAVLSLGRTFRVSGIVGLYGGYWLSGHRQGQSLSVSYLVSGDEADTFFDENYTFNSQRDRRFDAGLSYGIALACTIFQRLDLSVELHYYYGLTDVQKSYMSQQNPRYNTTRAIRAGLSYWL